MKKIVPLLSIIVFSFSCYHPAKKISGQEHLTSFHQISKLFADPPARFRPVPFWVWNGEMTRKDAAEQLCDLKSKGFGGVMVHPRYGMIIEYLSDDWFSLVKYSSGIADSLGMSLWLYDENSYPSGFAGGHVPDRMPESWNEGHALKMSRVASLNMKENRNCKHIFTRKDGKFHEITGDLPSFIGKRGDYYLFEPVYYPRSPWYAGFSYVDLLRKGVTEKFIEVTMDGYKSSAGHYFGSVIPGIFTDEPHISPQGGQAYIRWTPDLYDVFLQRNGYDLRPELPGLVSKTGNWKKTRHDYYATLLDMFIDRWAKPWYEYTTRENLVWTGHYWEHEWPYPRQGPDNMAMYAWHQMPGIDMLFNYHDNNRSQFGNIRSVKELSGIANQLGRHRTLSETYGGSGWELTFGDMKRNGDWEYVLGVNFMNQHLTFQTLAGDRKHDYPPSFSCHEPWWNLYKEQNDYFARLSLCLSSGEQMNPVLVIEPTTTAWMYYEPGNENPELETMRKTFHEFLSFLEKHQVEYDLGSEHVISLHGSVNNRLFTVGNRHYSLVILPPMLENLESRIAGLLIQYVENGGQVVSCTDPPVYVNGSEDERVMEIARKYPGQWIRADRDHLLNILPGSPEPWFVAVQPGSWGGEVYHQRRILDDGQLVFLVNYSLDEQARGTIRMKGEEALCLNPSSGNIYKYPAEKNDSLISISFTLHPAGSLLLFVPDDRPEGSWPEPESMIPAEVMPLDGNLSVKPRSPNVLTLDYCYLNLGENKEELLYFIRAAEMIYSHHGIQGNPWFRTIQFKKNILEKDSFGPGSGFRARFPFRIAENMNTAGLQVVVERAHLYVVSVNGQKVEPLPNRWWLDKQFGVFDIGAYTGQGWNEIGVEASPMSIHCELEPVYILGDFSLIPADSGFIICPPQPLTTGSWKAQGMPFYPDVVEYTGTFSAVKKAGGYLLSMGQWNGTVASVRVNGKEAGLIYTPPYEKDISSYVRTGKNEVSVLVYGSLKNLLGPHHQKERQGEVSPWSFRNAPALQPAGDQYDLLDYGLFEEFTVRALKKQE